LAVEKLGGICVRVQWGRKTYAERDRFWFREVEGSRQQTLGHRPTEKTGLGMTGHYTHTQPETLRKQIEQALRRWPRSLSYALEWLRSQFNTK
jgi:hypothetical protein